jgi:hypothetical protein
MLCSNTFGRRSKRNIKASPMHSDFWTIRQRVASRKVTLLLASKRWKFYCQGQTVTAFSITWIRFSQASWHLLSSAQFLMRQAAGTLILTDFKRSTNQLKTRLVKKSKNWLLIRLTKSCKSKLKSTQWQARSIRDLKAPRPLNGKWRHNAWGASIRKSWTQRDLTVFRTSRQTTWLT